MAQRFFLASAALIAACVVSLLANPSFAQRPRPKAIEQEQLRAEAGTIDGAIWAFKLTPRAKNPTNSGELIGRFRISNLEIFQAEKFGGELSKKVGVAKTLRKGAEAQFESLKALTPAREAKELKGKAIMNFVKPGIWEGQFIDGEGYVWLMNMKRVRE